MYALSATDGPLLLKNRFPSLTNTRPPVKALLDRKVVFCGIFAAKSSRRLLGMSNPQHAKMTTSASATSSQLISGVSPVEAGPAFASSC
eukprot:scaffold1226_cov250-Pinguiococcus_pyrenoidosus.AAC.7